jgi:hypothetical protein
MIQVVKPVWVSFVLAVGGAITFLFAPLGTQVEVEPVRVGEKPGAMGVSHPNVVQANGWSVAIPASVGIGLAAFPLAARGRWRRPVRTVSAVLLGAFVFLGIFSVGLFYMPAWVAMIVAAVSSGGTKEAAVS